MTLKVLDLFSGIGGFSLGFDRAGMETIAFCEIEDYPVSKLNKHWPDIPVARDIRKLSYNRKTQELIYDGEVIYVGPIGVICGGYPCQPFSVAGKQKGKEDDRHLWPEMYRLIKTIKPRWVVAENVAGHINMGLDDVLSDLENANYSRWPVVIPACAVGAVHRRDRVWIIAHSNELTNGEQYKYAENSKPNNSKTKVHGVFGNTKHNGRDGTKNGQSNSQGNDDGATRKEQTIELTGSGCQGCNDADTEGKRSQRIGSRGNSGAKKKTFEGSGFIGTFSSGDYEPIGLPIEPPVCHRDDGVSDRVARLKALGNAVVPQIPEIIGRAIMKIENKES